MNSFLVGLVSVRPPKTMKRCPTSGLGWIVTALFLRCALCFQTTLVTQRRRGCSNFADQRQPPVPVVQSVVLLRASLGEDRVTALVEAEDIDDVESKDSTFLRNIKSKLVFPLSVPLPRRPAPIPTPSKRASAFRRIRAFIVYPLRWINSLLRRRKMSLMDDLSSVDVEDVPCVEESVPDVDLVSTEALQVAMLQPLNLPTEEKLSMARESRKESAVKPGKAVPTKVQGDRWAVASVDLSGQWEILVTEDFKQQYDRYLTLLGQPMLVRSVALSIVGLTTEETVQKDNGRELFIRGRNVRGVWERSLIASGADDKKPDFDAILTRIVTADAEEVTSEAWWEDNGRVHVSWLRGVQKYGGGDFESRRYMDDDVLVCESTFHPVDENREKAYVTWRFRRQAK